MKNWTKVEGGAGVDNISNANELYDVKTNVGIVQMTYTAIMSAAFNGYIWEFTDYENVYKFEIINYSEEIDGDLYDMGFGICAEPLMRKFDEDDVDTFLPLNID